MPTSGKYDFKGIKKLGAAGLRVALASSPYTAWTLRGGSLTDFFLEFFVNWAANNGLMLLNIGADFVGNELDQRAFDSAMDRAYSEIALKQGRDKLTPEDKKRIDDEVINAGRRFIIIGKP